MEMTKEFKKELKERPTMSDSLDMKRYRDEYSFAVYDIVEFLWGVVGCYTLNGDEENSTFINNIRIEIAEKYLPGYIKDQKEV